MNNNALTFAADAHISFDTPSAGIINNPRMYYNPDKIGFTAQQKDEIKRALTQFAATPEGKEWIAKGFLGEHGYINIVNSPEGHTLSIPPNTILLGTFDANILYRDAINEQKYHKTSLQRVLAHELIHLALKHQSPLGVTNEANEVQVIRLENAFMKKYYMEPERAEASDAFLRDGKRELKFNPNFDLGHSVVPFIPQQQSAVRASGFF